MYKHLGVTFFFGLFVWFGLVCDGTKICKWL